MSQQQDAQKQETIKSMIQKQNSIKVKKRISKLLLFLSILIPLLILGWTFYDQQKQLVQKILGINKDDQLIQTLIKAINQLTQQIQTNKIQIKSFLTQKDIYKLFQQKDNDSPYNPLRVYDIFVYNIVLFNINQKQSPLKYSLRQKLEYSIVKYFHLRSYLGKYVQKLSNLHKDDNIGQKLKITIQTGHISQIDQNYQSKIISFYQQQQYTPEHYIQSIFRQLQKLNRQKHCNYLESHKTCKQHTIYVLYQSNQKLMVNDLVDVGGRSSGREFGNYWSTEHHEVNVMVLLPEYIDHHQSLSTRVQQIIYQSLGVQNIIMFLSENKVKDKQSLLKSQYQAIIHKYIQINLMQKKINILNKITNILDGFNNIPYQKIDNQRRKYLMQMLQNILSKNSTNKLDFKENNFINDSLVNQFNKIDTFPSEYKLGALAPLAIILLYPLLTFIPYLFK